MSRNQLTPDKYMTPQEAGALDARLAALDTSDPLVARDHAYLSFLRLTGVRASEALNLERRDFLGVFDGAGGERFGRVHIRTLKQGLDRVVPVPGWLYDRCLSMAGAFPGSPIFASDTGEAIKLRRADQIWRTYRTCDKKLHSLRHTFGRELYRATRDILLVKYALGHASVSNTQIYTEMDMEDDLSRALGALRGAS
ncbi:MAG: tyrosine-type recombinase/integrase [Bdellovibrionaceae bacterium]|nr:tyrosine-type recombinase/integrase [Pseudobdellovibrionaceae bacterium]